MEPRKDPNLPDGQNPVLWVTFEVHEWFGGGSGSSIGVWIEALNVDASAGTSREPGTRLLVASEPR